MPARHAPIAETCARGHALVGDNLRPRAGGNYACRECRRLATARSRARKQGLPVPEMPPIVRSRPPLSPESRAAMSAKITQRLASPESRTKMAPVWQRKVGRKRSAETRRKRSEAKKGKALNDVQIAANTARRGKQSLKQIAANTARRGRPETIALARKAALAGRGVKKSDHMRAALSKTNKGRVFTPQWKANQSAAALRWWEMATDEQKAERPIPTGPWNLVPTSIEVAVEAILVELGEDYEAQRRMGRWKPDFVIESRRLVIECDGTYWHARPDAIDRDRRKGVEMAARGYRVARLGEEAIRQDAMGAVLQALVGAQKSEC